jgi:hypothetical protein
VSLRIALCNGSRFITANGGNEKTGNFYNSLYCFCLGGKLSSSSSESSLLLSSDSNISSNKGDRRDTFKGAAIGAEGSASLSPPSSSWRAAGWCPLSPPFGATSLFLPPLPSSPLCGWGILPPLRLIRRLRHMPELCKQSQQQKSCLNAVPSHTKDNNKSSNNNIYQEEKDSQDQQTVNPHCLSLPT